MGAIVEYGLVPTLIYLAVALLWRLPRPLHLRTTPHTPKPVRFLLFT